MQDVFSDEMRRNPYPMYDRMRSGSPVHYIPPPFDAWMILDYQGVKRALSDHDTFSSRVPAPPHWFIFYDPPDHTKLRGLISQAFTPRVVANLEPRIREISRGLLDKATERGEMDLAADYSIPLPMMVIAEMIGMPVADWPLFNRWSGVILKLSFTRSGGEEAVTALSEFRAVTIEMNAYLAQMIEQRRASPKDDLLTRLVAAEVGGEHLAREEILGFFQLLIVAGQETTTNLINNAVLCLIENPQQRELLEARSDLLPAAIEEVLRYRSPLQWGDARAEARRRGRRQSHSGREIGAADDRLRKPRPGSVPSSRPLRHRAGPESARRLRARHSLLLGRAALAPGGPHRSLGSVAAVEGFRARDR